MSKNLTITDVLNEGTGELEAHVKLELGMTIKTGEENDAATKQIVERLTRSNQPNFIFAIYDMCKPYISKSKLLPQDMSRLIVLASYENYAGVLMKKERTLFEKKDFIKSLRINKDNYHRFYDKVLELGIISEDENKIRINNDYFKKGKLSKKINATRLYREKIRYIFNSVDIKRTKKLGYFFMLLPYIHPELNIVCTNPDEEAHSEVVAMTVSEFAYVINYNPRHIRKLLSDLIQIRTINGESIIGAFLTGSFRIKKKKILINPSVMYAGKLTDKQVVFAHFSRTKNNVILCIKTSNWNGLRWVDVLLNKHQVLLSI